MGTSGIEASPGHPISWAPKTSQGLEERPRGEQLVEARAWVRVPGWEERRAW